MYLKGMKNFICAILILSLSLTLGCSTPRDHSLESIRIVVLTDHINTWLERSTGGPHDYKVFFVQSLSAREDKVLTQLSKNGVRVIVGTNSLDYDKRGAVLEKRSGLQAVLFTANVRLINSNEAVAESSAVTGELGGEFKKYRIIRKAGIWRMEQKTNDGHASWTIDGDPFLELVQFALL